MPISVYGGKMIEKKCPKKFPNVRSILGLLGQMSEVNFSPAETLLSPKPLGEIQPNLMCELLT